ncbi:MarR family winged helix-turn-helix transcriptional regulator [Hoeflea prorocentri]|nr:MarR family transcriptional regulator [Hoeflea prorocentri]MCY6381103.1 MarR family transcriptional regulator [Hoeflea prorocentri]
MIATKDQPGTQIDHGMLHDLVGHLLRHAFNRGQATFAEVFDGDGITSLQFMILELISRNPGISHSRISRGVGAAPSVVTTTLKPLLVDGTIAVTPSTRDRRVICYHMTESGELWFKGLRPKIEACEDLFARGLNPDERQELLRLLRILSDI